jgi:valyl-tRNA synthetase
LCKPVFGADPTQAKGAQAVLYHCIEEGLRLLHPFMPFVTEELWQRLARRAGDESSIMISKYPETQAALMDEEAESDIKAMLEVVGVVRSMRDSYGLKPSQRPVVFVRGRSAEVCAVMTRQKDNIATLAKTGELSVVAKDGEIEKGCGMRPVGDSAELHLVLKGMVDLDAEIAKLEKSIASKTAELAKLTATMSAASWEKVPLLHPALLCCPTLPVARSPAPSAPCRGPGARTCVRAAPPASGRLRVSLAVLGHAPSVPRPARLPVPGC